MARNTTITKGVRYTDENGKRHLLTREEFYALMKKLKRNTEKNKREREG